MEDTADLTSCPSCGTALTQEARFCSQCGTALDPTASSGQPAKMKWYYNVWVVLAMMFFVLGPFALPLVWKHPRWSFAIKVMLTLVTILYTVWLIDVVIRMVQAVMEQVSQFQATLGL